MTTMEVELTDVGKQWLQGHYSQGIVGEFDVKPFRLHGWDAEFIELHINSGRALKRVLRPSR